MERRLFVTRLPLALLAAPSLGAAQGRRKPARIGVLWVATEQASAPLIQPFIERLTALGYAEGRDIVLEQRWARGRYDDLPRLAAELVRGEVDVLIGPANAIVVAEKHATTRIPIVMVWTVDPVRSGFVTNLSRPEGNITGVTIDIAPDIIGKDLQLLRELKPGISRVAFLWNPTDGFEIYRSAVLRSADQLGLGVQIVDVRHANEFEGAFDAVVRERAQGVLLLGGPIFVEARARLGDLLIRHRLPSIGPLADMANNVWRCLMAYGPSYADGARRAAEYVDKILKGVKPADLPVEQPTKFELVINLKTAKAMGLTIPPSLLSRADQVIE